MTIISVSPIGARKKIIPKQASKQGKRFLKAGIYDQS
jgi:hypothetical protein